MVKWSILTRSFRWGYQFIDWLKFETRPSSLLNFRTAYGDIIAHNWKEDSLSKKIQKTLHKPVFSAKRVIRSLSRLTNNKISISALYTLTIAQFRGWILIYRNWSILWDSRRDRTLLERELRRGVVLDPWLAIRVLPKVWNRGV